MIRKPNMKEDRTKADFVRKADGTIVKTSKGELNPIAAALYAKPSDRPETSDGSGAHGAGPLDQQPTDPRIDRESEAKASGRGAVHSDGPTPDEARGVPVLGEVLQASGEVGVKPVRRVNWRRQNEERMDFTDCYLAAPIAREIKGENRVAGIDGWEVDRLRLTDGRVIYRLADGKPEQVGIFYFTGGIMNYAPVSSRTFIPTQVLVLAKIRVAESYRMGDHNG
jgi:hypothetical protein